VAEPGRAAFERFVAEHGDRLLHTAYGLCGDWQHSEDLVQQALTTVARRWGAIDSNPLGYAYRCVVRSNIDRWRALSRRPEVLLDPHDIAAAGPPVSDAQNDGAVLAALHTLPPRQRAIVVLRYLQDLSESDTANALGISIGAVKSGASRGLARLRQMTLEESNHE
jgi:RNA polymerase sigma-70 factor (sigma-E family)